MNNKATLAILALIGLTNVLAIFWMSSRIERMAAGLERLSISLQDRVIGMKTEWTSGGTRRSWTTARNSGESDTDWLARHAAEIKVQWVTYPPDV